MPDEQAFRTIGSALSSITTHEATAAFTTGSFSYTPEELRTIVTRFLDLADSYLESVRDARTMALVEGPGLDYASQSHASVASSSGQPYLQSLVNERRYCLEQAQKFQDALHDYLGLEHRSVTQISQAGPQDGI